MTANDLFAAKVRADLASNVTDDFPTHTIVRASQPNRPTLIYIKGPAGGWCPWSGGGLLLRRYSEMLRAIEDYSLIEVM